MFRRFSSLTTIAGLVVLASGHGSASQPPAQSPGCPTDVQWLTHPTDDDTRTPAEQLIEHLGSGFQGTILIPSDMTVELGAERFLNIDSCVTIKGTRGGLDPGALITATGRDVDGPVFFIWGQKVRIEGLRFRGPMTTDDRNNPEDKSVKAFAIMGDATATIDNNVFEFWSVAVIVEPVEGEDPLPGVSCRDAAPPVSITRNYFNRNANEDSGYGVGMHAGCARIEGNLFNKNRHAVASSGPAGNGQSYLARYNYVLEGGFRVCSTLWFCHWNQHFDVHGSNGGYGGEAGEYFDIAWNTIRGEQIYYQIQTRPAFMLRGTPAIGAYFHDNVVVHDDAGEAVRLKPGADCLDYSNGSPTYSAELCHLYVGANRYNTDLINELAVGDFDGDGRDDVFLANGTAWWYSSAGQTEWRFLRPSTLRVRDLRFGNFTGDARTDVLSASGPNWFVSSAGTASGMWWRGDGTRLVDCVFGDFDGDGVTDALRADGSTWSIAWHGHGPWLFQRDYWVRAADLRVADFTDDGKDDVFWISSNTWHLWDPAKNVVTRDNRKPVFDSDRPLLVVADFDGDGRADLAKTDPYGWIWLRTGTTAWASLRGHAGQSEYYDIRRAVIGRFTSGDRAADAIRYASSRFSDASEYGLVIWNGTQDAFVPWSPNWQEMR